MARTRDATATASSTLRQIKAALAAAATEMATPRTAVRACVAEIPARFPGWSATVEEPDTDTPARLSVMVQDPTGRVYRVECPTSGQPSVLDAARAWLKAEAPDWSAVVELCCFRRPPLSERDAAALLGVAQKTINRRKWKGLERLDLITVAIRQGWVPSWPNEDER